MSQQIVTHHVFNVNASTNVQLKLGVQSRGFQGEHSLATMAG